MAGWLIIARQEFRGLLRDRRFRWLCSAVGLCLLAVLIVGWQQTQTVRAQRTAANAVAREHWVTQPPKNPHAAAHYGVYAFKPQTALAFVDIGVDEHAGVVAFLEAHKRHDLTGAAAQDGRTQRLLALTAAGVLQYLLPLLIIVLAFDALAGEREHGTLRYLLSLGVRPRTLLAGKLAGIGAALGVALLPAAVSSFLLLWWLEDAPWDFVRLALMVVSYLLYGFIFLALTLAVSSRWSARMTLLGMLTFWAVSSFVVPRMVTDLAARWYPTPARAAFDAAVAHDIRQGIDGHNPQEERLKAFEARLLAQYNARRLEDLPINPAGLLMQESEEHSNQVYAHHYARLWSAFERQVALHNAAAVVAPVLAVRSLSMALAGTDVFHHLDFADAAERYRQPLIKTLNEDWAYNSTLATDETYVADTRLWTSVQPFTYTPPPLTLALKRQWLALAWLGGWLGFSLLALSSAARGLTATT
ncbi:DUF3526 domain-containing protein [Chloracidobacterium thermophilum]|uniref:ABC-type transport system involved in multi-copper enzyme maturation, permease component n=1 Tax=Chloracidobacterium thermophilum (strain B) TaxID=981222 RepID=G2LL92_CHLTF|nr:DUF3526 domain-containing protein [Chloracidobacterium thermophilum]AEP13768.1 hypothetical protein Cabther_B0771 [Chloracidobacterium thermophilum B]